MNVSRYVTRGRELLQTDAALTGRMALAGGAIFLFYYVVAGIVVALVGAWAGNPFGGVGVILAGVVVTIGIVYVQYRRTVSRLQKNQNVEPIDEFRHGELVGRIESLSSEMDIHTPTVMHTKMGVPNAYAVGTGKDATVVFSDELVTLLDPAELEGVAAHELAHLRNRDTILMQLSESVRWMVMAFAMVVVAAYGLLGALLLQDPNVSIAVAVRRALRSLRVGRTGKAIVIGGAIASAAVQLFTMALSRYREYVADQTAVEATGNPDALVSALQKIASSSETRSELDHDVPAALCIHGDVSGVLTRLFATHPPMQRRIERLERIYG